MLRLILSLCLTVRKGNSGLSCCHIISEKCLGEYLWIHFSFDTFDTFPATVLICSLNLIFSFPSLDVREIMGLLGRVRGWLFEKCLDFVLAVVLTYDEKHFRSSISTSPSSRACMYTLIFSFSPQAYWLTWTLVSEYKCWRVSPVRNSRENFSGYPS